MPRKCWLGFAPLALVLIGCGRFGQVNQGRVVQYDREKGLATFIQDSNYREPGKPRFDVLPPVTVSIPADPAEMGPAPEAGKLLAREGAGGSRRGR